MSQIALSVTRPLPLHGIHLNTTTATATAATAAAKPSRAAVELGALANSDADGGCVSSGGGELN